MLVKLLVRAVPTWAPFLNTWYPVTATLSLEAVHERLIWVEETAVAESPVGVDGACVSAAACVVAETDDETEELFPAASKAETV